MVQSFVLRWGVGVRSLTPPPSSMGLPARPGTRVLFDFQGTEQNAERRSVILPCPEMPRCVWRSAQVFACIGPDYLSALTLLLLFLMDRGCERKEEIWGLNRNTAQGASGGRLDPPKGLPG